MGGQAGKNEMISEKMKQFLETEAKFREAGILAGPHVVMESEILDMYEQFVMLAKLEGEDIRALILVALRFGRVEIALLNKGRN